eukprot:TRINITY_DN142_c0_g1_i2.p1 TRINITY_DN142_c0_g1~~TRINITY_DN142_c0_g1_i2.p1  ORF type:complete len:327 (-),score=28.78 TRINITY_DN142_c0_g1_i2:78-1058(-)
MILKELNHYRRKHHYFPRVKWYNALAATAAKEAEHIISKRSFGSHANFQKWRKSVHNKYLAELSLLVNTEGKIPRKRLFAKTIVEALKQEQEWYLIHPYTQAGVALLPAKKRHHYVVVIHLIRRPSRFRSCKEAKTYGSRKKALKIFIKGKKTQVKCDQKTNGGGWTRILDMNQQQFGRVIQPINDLGLHYNQLFFKAKPNYYFDYAKGGGGNVNNWDFNGYVFPLNCLKFGAKWYMSAQTTTHQAQRKKIPHAFFNMKSKDELLVLKGNDKCYFGKANRVEYCAKEFILKKIPKGGLNAISDVESILNLWTADNQWAQYYEIYVR